MKSKRAKEYLLDRKSPTRIHPISGGVTYSLLSRFEAEKAIDLAEQETDKRLKKKAIKAYCHDCCCTVVGTCKIGVENCISLRNFTQKLNDDENDD